MSMILNEIKFEIDINNDKLLETVWEKNKKEKKSWSSLIMQSNVEPNYIIKKETTKNHVLLVNKYRVRCKEFVPRLFISNCWPLDFVW
jgi:hypothetical protein